MTPEIKIWRDKLNSSVAKIDDIFEAAFLNAQKVMDEDALTAWLVGADKIYALGRGKELILIFLDEMPEVVAHSDPEIIPEVAELAAHLSKNAVRGSIQPFLATLPHVAKRLNSATSCVVGCA